METLEPTARAPPAGNTGGAEGAGTRAAPAAPPQQQTLAAASAELESAVRLLQDPKAADLHGRHAAAIERMCRAAAAAGGFAAADLPRLTLLLDILLPLVLSGARPEFAAPLCGALRLLGRPLVRRALSDEARLPAALAALLRALAHAFGGAAPAELQAAAAGALEALSSAYHRRPGALQLRPPAQPGGAKRPGSEEAAGSGRAASPAVAAAADGDLNTAWRTYHLNQRCVRVRVCWSRASRWWRLSLHSRGSACGVVSVQRLAQQQPKLHPCAAGRHCAHAGTHRPRGMRSATTLMRRPQPA